MQEAPGGFPGKPGNHSRVPAAWVVAVAVDAIQLVTAPLELTGLPAWLLEVGVDLATMAVMMFLLGFHWAFLPSFVTKMLPFLDLAPTWTLAVYIATRGRQGPAA
jgi:hypothetical protein